MKQALEKTRRLSSIFEKLQKMKEAEAREANRQIAEATESEVSLLQSIADGQFVLPGLMRSAGKRLTNLQLETKRWRSRLDDIRDETVKSCSMQNAFERRAEELAQKLERRMQAKQLQDTIEFYVDSSLRQGNSANSGIDASPDASVATTESSNDSH